MKLLDQARLDAARKERDKRLKDLEHAKSDLAYHRKKAEWFLARIKELQQEINGLNGEIVALMLLDEE